MVLVDFFPKEKVTCFFSCLLLISGNGKLFVISSWQKKKELTLHLFSPTPFPFRKLWWLQLDCGGFCVRFSIPFCVLQFADLKSLSWRVLKKGSGAGLGNTPFIAFAIPDGIYKYESNYWIASFYFQHENPFWIISPWYFLCCLYHICEKKKQTLQLWLTLFHFSFQSEGISFLIMTSNNRVQHWKKLLGIYLFVYLFFGFCFW